MKKPIATIVSVSESSTSRSAAAKSRLRPFGHWADDNLQADTRGLVPYSSEGRRKQRAVASRRPACVASRPHCLRTISKDREQNGLNCPVPAG
jgi:hypothetical protein